MAASTTRFLLCKSHKGLTFFRDDGEESMDDPDYDQIEDYDDYDFGSIDDSLDSDDYDQIFDSDSSDRFLGYSITPLNLYLVPPMAIYLKIMTITEKSLTTHCLTRK